jgi:drug/metabolite transporter (DMT)-like permease
MSLRSKISAYLLVNLATLFWASNIALGRALRDQIGPVTLSAARFLVGGLIYALLFQAMTGNRAPTPAGVTGISHTPRQYVILAGMGLSGVFAFPILLYQGLKFTTAAHAALIIATGPLFTLLFSAVLLRQKVQLKSVIGMIISLVGVAFVIGTEALAPGGQAQVNPGDVMALVASALWGLYSVLARLAIQTRSTFSATALSTWMAVPFLLLAGGMELRSVSFTPTMPVLLGAIYIGIFPTVISFLAWNEGIRRVGPGQAMAFYNMLVVYGALLGAIFLGESLTWQVMLGGALVVAGGVTAA